MFQSENPPEFDYGQISGNTGVYDIASKSQKNNFLTNLTFVPLEICKTTFYLNAEILGKTRKKMAK